MPLCQCSVDRSAVRSSPAWLSPSHRQLCNGLGYLKGPAVPGSGDTMPNSGVGAEPSDRTCLNVRTRSRRRMIAPRMRGILGVIRPRIVETQRVSQRDSLQTDWARDGPSFSVDSELRRETEAVGNQPVSLLDVKRFREKAYDARNGGGRNCTRRRRFESTPLTEGTRDIRALPGSDTGARPQHRSAGSVDG
jgi:hypothetical protein